MLFLHDVGVFDAHPCEGIIKLVRKIYSTSKYILHKIDR